MLAMHLRVELRSRYVNINITIFNGSQFSSIPLLLGQAPVTVAEAPEGHLVLVTGKPHFLLRCSPRLKTTGQIAICISVGWTVTR